MLEGGTEESASPKGESIRVEDGVGYVSDGADVYDPDDGLGDAENGPGEGVTV